MAAGQLPAAGTALGPCNEACTHKDCACTRAMAEAACARCEQPIGYQIRFFQIGDAPPLEQQGDTAAWKGNLAHETCLIDQGKSPARRRSQRE